MQINQGVIFSFDFFSHFVMLLTFTAGFTIWVLVIVEGHKVAYNCLKPTARPFLLYGNLRCE